MSERGRDEAVGVGLDGAGVASPGEGCVVLEELQRGFDGGIMARPHLCRDGVFGQCPQQRDALGRREAEGVPGHLPHPTLPLFARPSAALPDTGGGERTAQGISCQRVAALAEQLRQLLWADLPSEPDGTCPTAQPTPRLLAVASEIVLPAEPDLLGVVAPTVGRHLGQAHHLGLTAAGAAKPHPKGAEVSMGDLACETAGRRGGAPDMADARGETNQEEKRVMALAVGAAEVTKL